MTLLPNSLEARDVAYYFHPAANARRHEKLGPLVMESGRGIFVRDDQGKDYIEGLAGLWSVAVGFGEPRLVEAAARQMAKLPYYHSFSGKSHPQPASPNSPPIPMSAKRAATGLIGALELVADKATRAPFETPGAFGRAARRSLPGGRAHHPRHRRRHRLLPAADHHGIGDRRALRPLRARAAPGRDRVAGGYPPEDARAIRLRSTCCRCSSRSPPARVAGACRAAEVERRVIVGRRAPRGPRPPSEASASSSSAGARASGPGATAARWRRQRPPAARRCRAPRRRPRAPRG